MSSGGLAVAVVADDLSGAAELGGVGWRRGLNAEVHTELGLEPAASLVATDTDSRTRPRAEAQERLRRVGAWLAERRPGLVYKKTDSVLRGWVRAELEALLEVLSRPRALLVPANPSLGRVIREGRYLVGDDPIHKTDFANDPLHPITSSDVLAMLGREGTLPVRIATRDTALPDSGIAVGTATRRADLRAWAERIGADTLAAGAAEFFDAVLETEGHASRRVPTDEVSPNRSRLLVSGTAFETGRRALDAARERGVPVLPMPEALVEGRSGAGDEALRRWADAAVQGLERAPLVAVTIARDPVPGPTPAARLVGPLAELVARVLRRRPLAGVLLEGGATAAAVIRRQGWVRLRVRRELTPGVVELETGDEHVGLVTIKPGSYAWPEKVWSS